MIIELNDKKIKVEIIRKPNKNIYMRFSSSLVLTISCNKWLSEKDLQKIIEKNHASLENMQKQKQMEEEKNIFFWYLGKSYVRIFNPEVKTAKFYQDTIMIKDEKMLQKFYKEECIRVFQNEINRIVPYFENIPPFSLKIRNMKTRWGVNNITKKTITLNSELLKKELDLIDYVIIHELCHFYEANHSSKFWHHVEKYYPKYKEARKRLNHV